MFQPDSTDLYCTQIQPYYAGLVQHYIEWRCGSIYQRLYHGTKLVNVLGCMFPQPRNVSAAPPARSHYGEVFFKEDTTRLYIWSFAGEQVTRCQVYSEQGKLVGIKNVCIWDNARWIVSGPFHPKRPTPPPPKMHMTELSTVHALLGPLNFIQARHQRLSWLFCRQATQLKLPPGCSHKRSM